MNSQHQEVAAILRSDFYNFIQQIFSVVSPGQVFVPNWHIEAIAYQLTRILRGECRRLVITVPPRNLKSICASVAFPAFVLGHDPTRRIVCVSYAQGLANNLSNDCRAVMRSRLYGRLFPDTRISLRKDTEAEFTTTHGGNRLATSVGGTLTGRGGNLIIIDDPMKPQEAMSETARESTKQWYANTLLSRLDNKTKDAIVVVMQRLHLDDLVGHLLEREGWDHLNFSAIAEYGETFQLGPGRFHRREPGDVLHPNHEPLDALEEFRHSMGSMAFAAQYQQEPVAEGGNLIRWNWFRFHDNTPSREPDDRIVVSWDTALSAKELASFSVCIVLQIRDESIFVLDVIRERLEYPDLKRKVIDLHQRWKRVTNDYSLLIENKGSGMSLIQDLNEQRIYPIPVNPEGDKVIRMSQQTARIEAGSVSLPRHASWLDEFRRELMAFPAGRHSDQVDALSQALHRAFDRRGGEFSCSFVKGLW